MKRFELFFLFLQLPIDFVMIVLAGSTAYFLRFSKTVTAIRPVVFNIPWERYWPVLAIAAAGWIIIFALSGLYSTNPNRKLAGDFAKIILACSTGFAGITMYVFFALQRFDSRFLVAVTWFFSIFYVSLGRLIVRSFKGMLFRRGVGLKQTALIGSTAIAETIMATFRAEPRLGYAIAGHFDHFDSAAEKALFTRPPDEIIFTDPKAHEEEVLRTVAFANQHHLVFKYSADLFATISTNMSVSTVAGVPIIELRRTRLTGWGKIMKRLVDIIGGILLLILCSPLLLVTAIAVLLETGRPIIYKNERVGHYGKKFLTLKFRTMYQKYCTGPQFGVSGAAALKTEADLIKTQNSKTGPIYKIKDDPRITPLGRTLRKFSLDEMPQFWNVLKGEMSLVGPRPHQPREVASYEKQHKILFAIKPGLTGLAQISGRSSLAFEEETRLDAFYVENWSLYLDFIILVKTPFIVLKKTGSVV
ncbi:MAG: sugar transferase [Candidatus Magasanikbacteria bacterium]|nr:sugar transferase [Candidatus Magasanikbacteria bacterium]